jgi:AcrR family transcriptional regulator
MPAAGSPTRILEAALALFLEHGYERTSVASICTRARVSNGTLFHHFETKEAIADALYLQAIASFQEGVWELLRRRPRSLRAAVRAVIEHQLRWTEQHPDLARFVYARDQLEPGTSAGADLASLNQNLIDELREWLAPFVERGEVRQTSIVMITAIVNGPTHALARRWLHGGLDRPLSGYRDELTDAAVAGLGARARSNQPRR